MKMVPSKDSKFFNFLPVFFLISIHLCLFSVYDEVPGCLEKWSKICKIAIYSSGSVQAQRLLFAHTEFGNLNTYIQANFDIPTAGSKIQSASYTVIHENLKTDP